MEISNLHDKEFKVMIIKMLNEFGRRKMINRDRKYKKGLNRAKEYNN